MDDDLLARWCRTLAPLLPADAADPGAAGAALLTRWAEPHRRYHDPRHLREVLAALDELAGPADPPATAVLAAYWHDAVYDPQAAANEERSAVLATTVLADLGIAPDLVAEVARLVRATADHVVDPTDPAGVLLCDADLAVLAAAPERYAEYAADVRVEYAHVPDEAFGPGRSAVLRSLVDRPRVYTGAGPAWEERARANVAAELDRLSGPLLPTGCAAAPRRPAG